MDIKDLLEKAKELLERDKKLVPVLFVDTEKETSIIGLSVNFNEIDKNKMMINAGRRFANKRQIVESLCLVRCLVSDANFSKINIVNNSLDKCESIVIAKLDVNNNYKKETIIQDFERSNDDIIFKDSRHELDDQSIFLLEAFMKGYRQAPNIDMN